MKHMILKRLFTATLALAMVAVTFLAIIPHPSAKISGSCGSDLKWDLDTETGVFTVSGTGAMNDYSMFYNHTQAPWVPNRDLIKTVIIENGATSIGDSAFIGCENLTSVTIPSGITSIGSAAFADCTKLQSITIPASVTTLLADAFNNCNKLESVIIKENSQLTTIGDSAFYYCSNLVNITIPEGVTSIGYSAFFACQSLTSIDIPDSVMNIGNLAFGECQGLIQKENGFSYVDNWVIECDYGLTTADLRPDTAGIGPYALSNSFSIKSIVLPEALISISEYAFVGSGITSISIPDNVRHIGLKAFYNCRDLSNISFGENSKLSSIGESAFEECVSLTSIKIPDSVTSLGNRMFYNCSSLTSATLPKSISSIGEYMFYMCYNLTNIELPASITSIDYEAFYNCSSLQSLVIPASVTTIGGMAFANCHKITSITVSKNSKLTNIGLQAFYHCDGLTKFIYCGSSKEWDMINAEGGHGFSQPILKFHDKVDGICTQCGEMLLGDVSNDGDITNSDVLVIYRYIFNSELYPLNVKVADLNKDGSVTNADVLILYRYIFDPKLYPIE